MVFENGVKNIQAAAYNGARTVFPFLSKLWDEKSLWLLVTFTIYLQFSRNYRVNQFVLKGSMRIQNQMANNEKKRMLLLLSHTSVLSDNFQKETTENVPRDLIDGMAPLLLKNHNDMYTKVIH